MAVPEQTPYIEHIGNGATTSFALKFQCESKDHLIVLVDEIEPPIATWSLIGGDVVFTTAPASGSKITLQRNTPFSRTTDYQSYNNSFRPPAVNKDFDWIWLKLQELGVADWILSNRIDALKNYVDDRDDELRAYLMEEIRKQGVALDQLDEYYNYLMERLAQIAVDKGWDASFVVDASGDNQQEINDRGGSYWREKPVGYSINSRVMLNNGNTVISTINGNTNNPNEDMTGWRNPKAEQDALNATLIRPYNPSNYYANGAYSIKDGVIQKLISGVWKRTEFRVDDFLSVSATAAASNILSTKSFYVPLGTHNIPSTIFLSGYHHIRGEGDMSDLLVSPGITGFEYNATTGAYDDHPNRSIKDVRIRGDGISGNPYLDEQSGTTIGFHVNNSGSRGNIEGVTFDRHGTGLKVQRSYTNIGRYNYYRANKVGLHLDGVTSCREEQMYARFNSTAAVLITGIMQNVTFAGGAIEGNRGRGIWVKDLAANPYFHLHLDDLYMEACGDRAAGVPAVDVVAHDWVHVAVKGGSYWSNAQAGIFSGAYKWGNSVSFEAATLGYAHYAKKGSVKDGIFSATLNTTADLNQARLWGLTEPMLVSEFRPTVILNTTSSPVFQVPFKGRPTVKHYLPNSAVQNYPHVTVLASGVTVSENTAANYGDGSWTDIAFTATGDYGAGYAELFRITENADGTRPNTLHTFLLRPTSDMEVGFEARGGATVVHRSHFKLVAGRTYKIMCVAHIEWLGTYFFRMFSLNGAGTMAYLPIYSTLASNKQNIIDLCNTI